MESTYNKGAVLYLKYILRLREHVEYEKFLARMLKDDENTREFKQNTQNHPNKLHAFRYNNEDAIRLTAESKNGTKQPST